MRGTLGLLLEVGLLFGIIPALAGNTRAMESQTYAPRDHPRACGEHIVRYELYEQERGSSPRLRGTLFNCFAHVVDVWIIPALAGNTPAPTRTWATSGDHPRACGEHVVSAISDVVAGGSSPRLRGTPGHTLVGAGEQGIIPALAGNTRQSLQNATACGDHPRACGEHFTFNATIQPLPGSSPRLRGTPHRVGVWHERVGIIPALAGNTRWPR